MRRSMGLPRQRFAQNRQFAAARGDLKQHPRVSARCRLCGPVRSRLVCSTEDITEQRKFLKHFYSTRWKEHRCSTATDRLNFTQDYTTEIVACTDCGLLYRNPRPRAEAVSRGYEMEHYDGRYLFAELEGHRAPSRRQVRGFAH